MFVIRNVFLLLVIAMLSACSGGGVEKRPHCTGKEQCLNDPNCLCWCSQVCNWRKKTAADHPVYIENDPYGKHCYCKQWDYDYYEDNCIHHKDIKQPKGTQ